MRRWSPGNSGASIGRSDIVHSLYGQWWPLDTPYLTNLIARLRGKCLMINVEASPWRIMRGERASLLRRWQSRSRRGAQPLDDLAGRHCLLHP